MAGDLVAELEPCPDPDCGCYDVQVKCGSPGRHWVECRACGLRTRDKSRERAVAQWNRLPRASQQPAGDVVEASEIAEILPRTDEITAVDRKRGKEAAFLLECDGTDGDRS